MSHPSLPGVSRVLLGEGTRDRTEPRGDPPPVKIGASSAVNRWVGQGGAFRGVGRAKRVFLTIAVPVVFLVLPVTVLFP
jgi:hypothetical protein